MFLEKELIRKLVQSGEIIITDFKEEHLKAASYTLTLAPINGQPTFTLNPGEFALLETKEKITIRGKYCGIMATPSALAQQGVNVTQGSNFAEPDTDNTIILETSNNGNKPVTFITGMKVLKIAFARLES